MTSSLASLYFVPMPRRSSSRSDIFEDPKYNRKSKTVSQREIEDLLSGAGKDCPDIKEFEEASDCPRTRRRVAKESQDQATVRQSDRLLPREEEKGKSRESKAQVALRELRESLGSDNSSESEVWVVNSAAPAPKKPIATRKTVLESSPQSLPDSWQYNAKKSAQKLTRLAGALKREKGKERSEESVQKIHGMRKDFKGLQNTSTWKPIENIRRNEAKKHCQKAARKERASQKAPGRQKTQELSNTIVRPNSKIADLEAASLKFEKATKEISPPLAGLDIVRSDYSRGKSRTFSEKLSQNLSNPSSCDLVVYDTFDDNSVTDEKEANVSSMNDHIMQNSSMNLDQKGVSYPLTEECHHYTHVSEIPWDIQK